MVQRHRSRQRVRILAPLTFVAVAALPARSAAQITPFQPVTRLRQMPGAKLQVIIPLDETGVASWDYLNRRNPPYVFGSLSNPADWGSVSIAFFNRTADRIIQVKLPTRYGPCDSTGKNCKVVTVNPGQLEDVSITDIVSLVGLQPVKPSAPCPDPQKRESITFGITFFHEIEPAAHAQGYFSIVPTICLKEPDSRTVVNAVGTVEARFEPVLNDALTPQTPYAGDRLQHFPFTGLVNVKRAVGLRADVDVDLRYRNSDLGGADTTATGTPVQAIKYQLNAYGVQGLRVSFGRFAVAKPSDGIAVNEFGDAVTLNFRNFGGVWIVKRESEAGTSNAPNQDKDVWIFRANELPFPSGAVRSVDLLAVFGRDKRPADGFLYRTIGGELHWNIPQQPIAGAFAAYFSHRRHRDASTAFDGDGWAWQGSGGWTSLDQHHILRAVIAAGSGDEAGTPVREDYVGESAAFAPDQLLLAKLAPRLPVLGAGLSNKLYAGGTYRYTEFSLLSLPATLLSSRLDIKSQSIAFSARRYFSNGNSTLDSLIGSEFDVESILESPAGVQFSISTGWFFAGPLVRDAFARRAWTLSLKLSVIP